MQRPCQRARLESGLKLDLSRFARRGFVQPGAATGPAGIRWTDDCTEGEIGSGFITANMRGTDEGWLRIQIGQLDQRIILVPRPRHFGSQQWFFLCPCLSRRGEPQRHRCDGQGGQRGARKHPAWLAISNAFGAVGTGAPIPSALAHG